jgi:hypothetical protein
LTRGSIVTQTRQATPIPNGFDRNPLPAGKLDECDGLRLKYPRADHRRQAMSSSYNCHGLTFASRRTEIHDPQAVRMILREDDYKQISRPDLLVGDTVIYVEQGDVSHSGIVVGVPQLDAQILDPLAGVKVLSKWGEGQEVIHEVRDCPYPADAHEFWRVHK